MWIGPDMMSEDAISSPSKAPLAAQGNVRIRQRNGVTAASLRASRRSRTYLEETDDVGPRSGTEWNMASWTSWASPGAWAGSAGWTTSRGGWARLSHTQHFARAVERWNALPSRPLPELA